MSFPSPFPYQNFIKTPPQAGISTDGTWKTLTNDLGGIMGYGDVLIFGDGLSTTGMPLGNQTFVKTPATCVPKDGSGNVQRYIYIDNIPDGSIPFMSTDENDGMPKGLVPGVIGNLEVLDPTDVVDALAMGDAPECQLVSLHTTDNSGNTGFESQYLVNDDIKAISPCSFQGGVNPVSMNKCPAPAPAKKSGARKRVVDIKIKPVKPKKRSGFVGSMAQGGGGVQLPGDPIVLVYVFGLAFVGLYILGCLAVRQTAHRRRRRR